MTTRGIVIICFIVICFVQSIVLREAQAKELDVNSSFYVLVDLSKTYFNKNTKGEMRRTLNQVNASLLELSTRHLSPALFTFLSIDKISLGKKPLCEAALKATIFGGGKSEKYGGMTVYKNRKKLKNFFDVCRDLILIKKPKMGTDISGAVDLASRMAKGQSRGSKAMIIISDFFEERVEGASTADLNLRGFKVALVYGFKGEKAINSKLLDENVKAWRKRLLKAGAESVEFGIESGVLSQFIINKLAP